LTRGKPDYPAVQQMVQASLPMQVTIYNEFHALLVHVGKHWCRPSAPRCHQCPLATYLPAHSPLLATSSLKSLSADARPELRP